MRRLARIIRIAPLLMFGLLAGVPTLASAAVTAQGVALNAAAGCSSASLDLTLTTVGASRELGLATNLAGATLDSFEQATTLTNFSGTFTGYNIGVNPTQPAGTLIGSYAYVGTTAPLAATTGEFFIYYNCSTRQVLLSCYGPYGTCPQTAQQAQARLAIPTFQPWGLALTVLLLAAIGSIALRRRS